MKFAINGFGRIGRTLFRSAYKLGLMPSALNDLGPIDNLAYLLKYDSSYGKFEGDVRIENGNLIVDDKEIKVFNEPDPKKLSWDEEEIDLVIESTGKFTEYGQANNHISAGAKMVLISAPYKGEKEMKTIIYGINHQDLKVDDKIVSMASCTTNCLVPVAKILEDEFGVKKAMMNTMHSFTMDQMLQDAPHKDFRRGRNALQSIIPTSSGATIAASRIIPELKNKMDGYSFRVPTPIVSVLDFIAVMKKEVKVEELQEKFKHYASEDKFLGSLEVTDEPLVSVDFKANEAASIVDLNLIQVVDGDLVRIVAYYDNEMGYSARMASLIKYIGEQIFN
ncbi:MAG: type I glyceraldehyde-3-phosphate dehydrogenase [Patescibacteria group bacterium]|nr:type I glyceraldehyde-3-phosphate dehydrogenase [Patescibacteria group bacterium]